MGEKVELTVELRSITGKKVSVLRRDGYTPVVIYGHDTPAASLMAPSVAVAKVVRTAGKHQPVELTVDGKKQLAMIKSTDVDPVKHQLRHVAFHAIKQNEEVETEIPVVITGTGETPAEKAGLVVLTGATSVEVKALPAKLPDQLEVDGAKLAEIGDHLTVADLKVPSGVTIVTDESQILATVYEPSALQAANEDAGGEAEPGDEADVESAEGVDASQESQAEESKK